MENENVLYKKNHSFIVQNRVQIFEFLSSINSSLWISKMGFWSRMCILCDFVLQILEKWNLSHRANIMEIYVCKICMLIFELNDTKFCAKRKLFTEKIRFTLFDNDVIQNQQLTQLNVSSIFFQKGTVQWIKC